MAHKLILASAGAGKSRSVAEKALALAESGKTVLILTYTINNQAELLKHICLLNKYKPRNIVIKGWFSFLLEDMIRPYQRCIAPKRLEGIVFDQSDPHFKNGKMMRGRAEKNGEHYNLRHFLTVNARAHTTYLSKLACRVNSESGMLPAKRIAAIYDALFIDEVQDLVGWDFEVIEALASLGLEAFDCVGDFRQTIYHTASISRKKPVTDTEKLKRFGELGFLPEHMNISWRSIQKICDFADLVHVASRIYSPTQSRVTEIPAFFAEHQGIFVVSRQHVSEYIRRYAPVILRKDRTTELPLCNGNPSYNFGEAKGLGFDRVLVLPTENYRDFLAGKPTAFDKGKTDVSRNKLYVAITRARYSVAFLADTSKTSSSLTAWSSSGTIETG